MNNSLYPRIEQIVTGGRAYDAGHRSIQGRSPGGPNDYETSADVQATLRWMDFTDGKKEPLTREDIEWMVKEWRNLVELRSKGAR